eukprot:810050-Prorocentrum_minimum.AAC.1
MALSADKPPEKSQVYSLVPAAIGSRSRFTLLSLPRLGSAPGIFFCRKWRSPPTSRPKKARYILGQTCFTGAR